MIVYVICKTYDLYAKQESMTFIKLPGFSEKNWFLSVFNFIVITKKHVL